MNNEQLRIEADFHDDFYEEEADHIFQSEAFGLVKQRNIKFILNNISASTSCDVVSLGCGNGSFEMLLADKFKSIVGIDLSPKAIAIANNRVEEKAIPNLKFKVGNAKTIEFPDKSLDVVLVLSTFHHMTENDVDNLIKEAKRVLKPGGIVISTDPNYYRLIGLFKFLVNRTFKKYHSPEERVIPPSFLTNRFVKHGFRSAKVTWIDYFYNPFCWVFPKTPIYLGGLLFFVDNILLNIPVINLSSSGFGVVARK